MQILLSHVLEGYYNTAAVTEAFASADPMTGVTLPTLSPGVEVTATMVRHHPALRLRVLRSHFAKMGARSNACVQRLLLESVV